MFLLSLLLRPLQLDSYISLQGACLFLFGLVHHIRTQSDSAIERVFGFSREEICNTSTVPSTIIKSCVLKQKGLQIADLFHFVNSVSGGLLDANYCSCLAQNLVKHRCDI